MSDLAVNRAKFDELLKGDKPVLVDFYAEWCGPCRMTAPVIEEFAEKHPEFAVCKIDVDKEEDLASDYSVFSIPTLILFKGGEVSAKNVGGVSMAKLLEFTGAQQ
ncbi:MAG: thioredoxin [Lachnospiraceae bacterium]|nr:thioredoxin [Lachnospiraceae bacterium]